MLVPLLFLLLVMTVLGIVVAVLRDSHRKGYPAGYRRGHPLPPHPVRQMAPRPQRRIPPPPGPRGPRMAPPPIERRPASERPATATPSAPVPAPGVPVPPRRQPAPAAAEGTRPAAARGPAPEGAPGDTRTTPQIPPRVADGVTSAWERARRGAARAWDGVAAAATSPQAKRAGRTSREALESAASTSMEATRRLSVITREQFDRDPRRAGIVAAVVAGLVVLVLIVGVMLLTGGGGDDGSGGAPSTQPTSSSQGPTPPGTQIPGVAGTASSVSRTASPTASAAQSLPGNPYSETVITSTMQSRGLAPALVNEPFTCQNAGTTPHVYRVTANGAEQRFVLIIYPDATATNKDWAIGGGRPQYRNGTCANDASVIYFNQNVLMVIPSNTNQGLNQQVIDAFLALP